MITIKLLSQINLFSGLSNEQLATIAKFCKEIICSKGEMLFGEGEKAERLFILLEGEVALRVRLTSRPENITVAIINRAHQAFGWSGIVSPHFYTASAHCQATSRLLVLDGQELMRALEQNPAASFVVMRRIAEVISRRLRSSRVAFLKTL